MPEVMDMARAGGFRPLVLLDVLRGGRRVCCGTSSSSLQKLADEESESSAACAESLYGAFLLWETCSECDALLVCVGLAVLALSCSETLRRGLPSKELARRWGLPRPAALWLLLRFTLHFEVECSLPEIPSSLRNELPRSCLWNELLRVLEETCSLLVDRRSFFLLVVSKNESSSSQSSKKFPMLSWMLLLRCCDSIRESAPSVLLERRVGDVFGRLLGDTDILYCEGPLVLRADLCFYNMPTLIMNDFDFTTQHSRGSEGNLKDFFRCLLVGGRHHRHVTNPVKSIVGLL